MSVDTLTSYDVAISYPRGTLSGAARALRDRLTAAGHRVFLDTSELADGSRFPEEITRAFLHSRVIVVLADETYFRRWFCLREFRMAVSRFEQVAMRPGSTREQRTEALSHIVIGIGGSPADDRWMQQLPLDLRATQWPRAEASEAIAELVGPPTARPTVAESLATLGVDPRQAGILGPDALLPPPRNLNGFRIVPRKFSASIGDRFAGRADDLWRTDFLLRTVPGADRDGAPPVVVLEGGGGFGKTTLAREYVHRFGPDAFPGGIFWIDATGGEEDLDRQYHEVVGTLRPGIPALSVLRQQGLSITALLLEELDRLSPAARVLFVIDDVPEGGAGSTARPMEQWCPAVGRAAVLATSRRRLSFGDPAVTHGIFVGALPPEGAVGLLTSGVNPGALADDEWKAVAEWAGWYPLALELLNRTVLAGMHPKELFLETGRSTVLPLVEARWDTLREILPDGTWRGVVEALSVPWTRLTPEQRHGARILAQFGSGPIPLAVLDAVSGSPLPPAVRTALILRSYVTRLDDSELPAIGGMHPVHAEFVRCMSDTPREDCRLAADALEPLLNDGATYLRRALPAAAMCIPHGETVFDRLLQFADTPAREEFAAGFCMALADAVSAAGAPHRSVELLERFIARTALSADAPTMLSVHAHLGSAVADADNLVRAEQVLAEQAELQDRCAADPALRTRTLLDLARTLREQGRLHAAAGVLERARSAIRPEGTAFTLEYALTRFPTEVVRLLIADAELACDLGNLARADELHAVLAEVGREMEPAVRTSFEALGVEVLIRREEWGSAAEVYSRLVEVYRDELGPDHFQTRQAEASLGWVLCRLGRPREARQILRAFLRYTRRNLAPSSPASILAINNVGESFLVEGRARLARICFARAFAERCRSLPPWHPHLLYTARNLARSLADMGEHAGATDLLVSVLKGAGEHGAEHAERAHTVQLLARLQGRGAGPANAPDAISTAARAIARRIALLDEAPIPLVLLDRFEPHVFTASIRSELERAGAVRGYSHEPVPAVLADRDRSEELADDADAEDDALSSVRDALLYLLAPDRPLDEKQASLARQLKPHAIRVAERLMALEARETEAQQAVQLLLAAFLADRDGPAEQRARALQRLASAARRLPASRAGDGMHHLTRAVVRLCKDGNGPAAFELASLCASALEALVGPNHYLTLCARANVAEAVDVAGEYDRAVAMYQELLEHVKSRAGEPGASSVNGVHVEGLVVLMHLHESAARTFARNGRHEDALHNLRSAIPLFELADDPGLEIRSLFARTLVICGCLVEGVSVQEALVADARRLLGSTDAFTAEQEEVLQQLRRATG